MVALTTTFLLLFRDLVVAPMLECSCLHYLGQVDVLALTDPAEDQWFLILIGKLIPVPGEMLIFDQMKDSMMRMICTTSENLK